MAEEYEFDFERLDVYQKTLELVATIFRITRCHLFLGTYLRVLI